MHDPITIDPVTENPLISPHLAQTLGFVRHALTFGAGIAATMGYFSQGQAQDGLMTLSWVLAAVGVCWSFWQKYHPGHLAPAQEQAITAQLNQAQLNKAQIIAATPQGGVHQ